MAAERAARLERLEALFETELAERVAALTALLARVEQGYAADARGPLVRELHSLKGAARAIGSRAVEQLAHTAEGVVLQLAGQPDQAWCDQLYAVADAFQGLHAGTRTDVDQLITSI